MLLLMHGHYMRWGHCVTGKLLMEFTTVDTPCICFRKSMAAHVNGLTNSCKYALRRHLKESRLRVEISSDQE